jgi:hypothetical protein
VSDRSDASASIEYSARGNTRWIVLKGPWGRRLDRLLVRHLGVSVITWQYAKAGGVPYRSTLLLTTIGRRTGTLRPRALPYHRAGDSFVVIGSNGGGPTDPDWVWNVAEGEERERLFALIGESGDSLARYQQRASTFGRTVPLVVLEPRAGA